MPRPRKSTKDSGPQSLLTSIQGYYAAALLLELSRLGILESLTWPLTARSIATRYQLEAQFTEQLLEFLANTTTVVQQHNGRFQLAETHYLELAFQLEKFVGAYGPAVHMVGSLLRRRRKGPEGVNQKALANAFSVAGEFQNPFLLSLLERSGVRCLLDLGCGSAALLIQLARIDGQFRGIGVDASVYMCRYARQAIREAHLTSRIKIKHADGRDLRTNFSAIERKKVEALFGRSFLNQFFASKDNEAVQILKRLRRLFPDRRAWFSDYYGVLGQHVSSPERFPLALLQDVAQVASGQGVPPCDLVGWRRTYHKAGCTLKDVHEFEGPGIRWFIHEVEL